MARRRPPTHAPHTAQPTPPHAAPTATAAAPSSTRLADAYHKAAALRPSSRHFEATWAALTDALLPRLVPVCGRLVRDQALAVDGADDLARATLAAAYLSAAAWRARPASNRPSLPVDDAALIDYLATLATRLLRRESGVPRQRDSTEQTWRPVPAVDVYADDASGVATSTWWPAGRETERDRAIRAAYDAACQTLPQHRWRTVGVLELEGTWLLEDLAKAAGYASPSGALAARRAVRRHVEPVLRPLVPAARPAAKPAIPARAGTTRPRVAPTALRHLRPAVLSFPLPPKPGERTRAHQPPATPHDAPTSAPSPASDETPSRSRRGGRARGQ